ncbi:MAG: hypothetical protein KJ709_06805 [Nanoarchaeota archaeon]|nr:hypothetical protein [Nanoarchaeota archaeon]
MSDKTIPNAMDIAENVARIIFESSYRDKMWDERVQDLLLFGSTLTGESFKPTDEQKEPDIDILVIHTLHGLTEYGMFMKYDEEKSEAILDPEADITRQRYDPVCVLEEMGSVFGADNFKVWNLIHDGNMLYEGMIDQMPLLRNGNFYGGVVKLPLVGEVRIPVQRYDYFTEGFKHLTGYIDKAFDEKVASTFTVNRVRRFLEEQGMPIEPTLDLIAMHKAMLEPGKAEDQRKLALQQSGDPTFWNSILCSGRLYNKSTGKFDTRLDDKYPGGAELFRPD